MKTRLFSRATALLLAVLMTVTLLPTVSAGDGVTPLGDTRATQSGNTIKDLSTELGAGVAGVIMNEPKMIECGHMFDLSFDVRAEKATTVKPIDVVLVLDTSGSMSSGKKIENLRAAAAAAAADILSTPGNRVAVVTYADEGRIRTIGGETWNEASAKTPVSNWLAKSNSPNLVANGGTNIQHGLEKAHEAFNGSGKTPQEVDRYILLMSDGVPTYSYQDAGGTSADYVNYVDAAASDFLRGNGSSSSLGNYLVKLYSERTIAEAAAVKAATEATIYTVGLFDGMSGHALYTGRETLNPGWNEDGTVVPNTGNYSSKTFTTGGTNHSINGIANPQREGIPADASSRKYNKTYIELTSATELVGVFKNLVAEMDPSVTGATFTYTLPSHFSFDSSDPTNPALAKVNGVAVAATITGSTITIPVGAISSVAKRVTLRIQAANTVVAGYTSIYGSGTNTLSFNNVDGNGATGADAAWYTQPGDVNPRSIDLVGQANAWEILVRPVLPANVSVDASNVSGNNTEYDFSVFGVPSGSTLVLLNEDGTYNAAQSVPIKSGSTTRGTAKIEGNKLVIIPATTSNNVSGTFKFAVGTYLQSENSGLAVSCAATATVTFKKMHGVDITKTVSNDNVKVGDTVTYTLTVKNTSDSGLSDNSRLSNLVVTDSMLTAAYGATPPSSYTLDKSSVSITGARTGTLNQSTGAITFNRLDRNETVTITYDVTFNTIGAFPNTARAEDTVKNVSDTDYANVTAGFTTNDEYKITLLKVADPTPPTIIPLGGSANYTLTVKNTSPRAVDNIVLEDSMFARAASIKIDGVPASLNSGGKLDLGAFAAKNAVGDTKVITYSVTFTAVGDVVNPAKAEAFVNRAGTAPVESVSVAFATSSATVTIGTPASLTILKEVLHGDVYSNAKLTIDPTAGAAADKAALLAEWQDAQDDLADVEADFDYDEAAQLLGELNAAKALLEELEDAAEPDAEAIAAQEGVVAAAQLAYDTHMKPLIDAQKAVTDAEAAYRTYTWSGEAYFKITVTNSGDIAATGITLTDSLTVLTGTGGTLVWLGTNPTEAPGFTVPAKANNVNGSISFYAKATGLAKNSEYTNTATLSTGGSSSVDVGVNDVPAPAIGVTKQVRNADGGTFDTTADLVRNVLEDAVAEYQIVISNSASATAPGFVQVEDAMLAKAIDTPTVTGAGTDETLESGFTIPVGGSVTITYSVSVADLVNGSNFNTVTLSGDSDLTATAKVDVSAPWSEIDVTKSVVGSSVIAKGASASYKIEIVVSGDESVTNVIVSDDPYDFADGYTITGVSTENVTLSGKNLVIASVAPGTTVTITYSMVVDDDTDNTVTVTGKGSESGEEHSDIDEASVTVYDPKLVVTKTVEPTSMLLGETAVYTVTVKNDGDETLNNVLVADGMFAGADAIYLGDDLISLESGMENTINIGSLGEDETKTITYYVTFMDELAEDTDVPNTVSASGTGAETGKTVTASIGATIRLIVPNPSVSLTKTANPSSGAPSLTATYELTVTNTGNVPLRELEVIDDMDDRGLFNESSISVLRGGSAYEYTHDWSASDNVVTFGINFYGGQAVRQVNSNAGDWLMPGESVTISYTVTYNQDGTYPNIATVSGWSILGEDDFPTDEASATVTVTSIPDPGPGPNPDPTYNVTVNYYTRPDVNTAYAQINTSTVASGLYSGTGYSYTAQTLEGYTFDKAESASAITLDGMLVKGTISGGSVVINLYYTGSGEVIIEEPEVPLTPPDEGEGSGTTTGTGGEEIIEDNALPMTGGVSPFIFGLLGLGLIGTGVVIGLRKKEEDATEEQ